MAVRWTDRGPRRLLFRRGEAGAEPCLRPSERDGGVAPGGDRARVLPPLREPRLARDRARRLPGERHDGGLAGDVGRNRRGEHARGPRGRLAGQPVRGRSRRDLPPEAHLEVHRARRGSEHDRERDHRRHDAFHRGLRAVVELRRDLDDLLFAPPLLLWISGARPVGPRRPIEAACVGILLVATGAAFFGGIGQKNAPIEWFWIPVVVWVAYRFGQRAAATAVLGVAAVTVWGTELGLGPFVLPSPNASLLLLQAFLGVISVLALTLSAVVAAREQSTEDLRSARDELEERVRGRTEDLSRANESLREEMTQRSRLEKELIDAGERERLRVGRDLHDDLGQLLSGIAFLSSAVEKKLSAQSLPEAAAAKEIRSLVQDAIAKTHRLSLGLTPMTIGEGGFLTAIQELAAMTERVFGVMCGVECDQLLVVDRPVAATNLYRIVQESISNA